MPRATNAPATRARRKRTLKLAKGYFGNKSRLYTEAREVCRVANDYVSMDLFEALLKDEEGHINFLETQLRLYGEIGAERYGLLQAESADEAE